MLHIKDVFLPRDPEFGNVIDKVPILDYYDPNEINARHMWKKAFMGVLGKQRKIRECSKVSIADIVPKLRAIEILRNLRNLKLMR